MTATKDKFTLSYSFWIALPLLLFVFAHDLDRMFNLYLALVPLMLIPIAAVAIAWIVALIRNIVLCRWRRLASVTIAPFLAYAVIVGFGAAGVNPQSIRFALGKSSYLEQIAQLPATSEPRFKEFKWGDTGGAGVSNIFETLIYDESDDMAQIMLAPDQRSASWRSRMERLCPGAPICWLLEPSTPRHAFKIRKVDGHFYVVTEVYQ